MEFVKMTIDEAKKIAKKNATVLVAVRDLEQEDCNEEFTSQMFVDCSDMFEKAKTIAQIADDLLNQIRVFTEYQPDPINYIPKGKLGTILLQKSRHNDLK